VFSDHGVIATVGLCIAVCSAALVIGLQAAEAEQPREVREAAAYVKERGGPAPHIRTSAHFALRWGEENHKNFKLDDAYFDKALEWLEQLWTLYIEKLKFPAGRHKYKINAYITETGLKPFLKGYAYGFPDPENYGVLIGEPSIYSFGHNGAAHELTHALQGETLGFRDSDYVGWFWECHAQLMSHQATGKQDLPHVLDRYAQTSHWDVASTRHHYGCWIFFQYIAERTPDGMERVNNLWIEPRKYKDEEALGKLRRMYPFEGDRDKGWADLIGDYAKRNVTWNFYKLGPEYRRSLKFFDDMDHRNYFTYLEPSASRPGWFRVPRIYAPQQNGYNVIPLTPAAATGTVSVDLAGFVEPELRSEWRATLVAVGPDFQERFSETWASGTGKIDLQAGERLFLVVAATPLKHSPPKFVERFPDIPYYPYEIRCVGASPRNLSERIRSLPATVKGHAHPNGGGFVADSAHVADTAFVGKSAAVLDRARVEGSARIEDLATVSGDAVVGGSAVIAGNALITQQARVDGEALVTDFAELHDKAVVTGRARVFAAGRVYGSNEISDEAVVKGFSSIRGVKKMRGCAIADGEVEWDFSAPELATDICFGTLLQKEPNKQHESHHLYAHFPMNNDSAWRLRDAFGTNDGILQGGAGVAADPNRTRAVCLSGKSQFVDLPRELALHRQLTLATWVWLDSDQPEQCVVSFGRDAAQCFELLAFNADRAVGFRFRCADRVVELSGAKPPTARWFHMALAMGDSGCVLYVDGKKVAEKQGAVHPDDVRAARGYFGRNMQGACMAGRLSDASFYTRMLTEAEITTLKEKGRLDGGR
jgi:hypothetical protein